jgi:hypothetical protein
VLRAKKKKYKNKKNEDEMRINSKKNFFTPGSLISNTLLSFYFIFK